MCMSMCVHNTDGHEHYKVYGLCIYTYMIIPRFPPLKPLQINTKARNMSGVNCEYIDELMEKWKQKPMDVKIHTHTYEHIMIVN